MSQNIHRYIFAALIGNGGHAFLLSMQKSMKEATRLVSA